LLCWFCWLVFWFCLCFGLIRVVVVAGVQLVFLRGVVHVFVLLVEVQKLTYTTSSTRLYGWLCFGWWLCFRFCHVVRVLYKLLRPLLQKKPSCVFSVY
jgi:hypothetical protein